MNTLLLNAEKPDMLETLKKTYLSITISGADDGGISILAVYPNLP